MDDIAPSRARIVSPLALRLAGLAGLLLALAALWLLQGLGGGNWSFILGLRAQKLAALVTIGASVGVATVLFQTVSGNRILTPSIMGFDALYGLMQVLLVAGLGIVGFAQLPASAKFLTETALMAGVALLLFGTLLRGGARDVARTILTGVILGVLFRAGQGLVSRTLDPNDFAVVQSATFANFGRPRGEVLGIGMMATFAACAAAIWLSPRLDVMALGREKAVTLGLNWGRMVLGVLALVAVLVAVSTALVGPLAFLGLIVAGLAHAAVGRLPGGARHGALLPAAALIGPVLLIGGQWLFERLLGAQATLSVVIEFAGGMMFLALLLKGKIR